MAELSSASPVPSSCCAAEAQRTCCGADSKAECCGPADAPGSCGCDAGRTGADVRDQVRARYAAAARASAATAGNCCAPAVSEDGEQVFGGALYDPADRAGAGDAAIAASLGCGVPTAVAGLREGEVVLDLGSGAGADVLISAARVGARGKVYGLDMTDEMLDLARANAAAGGVENVIFLKGYIEEVPLPGESVDVVLSNCVINLSADKRRVLAEAARVLRPGGRLAVSDVVADADMDEATRADMRQWTGCIAGALTREEFMSGLRAAGFSDIAIEETHRVHERAVSAVIRARKVAAPPRLQPGPGGGSPA